MDSVLQPADKHNQQIFSSVKWDTRIIKSTKRNDYVLPWPIEDTLSTFKIQFYRAIKSNYRAINDKLSRDKINGKLVRSHVIGCHARCFRGRDDNGCNS